MLTPNKHASALVAIVLLAACTAIGVEPARSFSAGWAYAMGQTTAIRQAATDALEAGSLSVEDAEYALRVTDQSRALLEAARAAYASGDITTADGRLTLTTQVLTQLQAYLRSKGGKP